MHMCSSYEPLHYSTVRMHTYMYTCMSTCIVSDPTQLLRGERNAVHENKMS